MDTFAKRLTDCSKAKNLSQKELAEAFVTSHTTIGKYERSEVVPSIEVAKKNADAFEASLDYLVGEGINSKFGKKTVTQLQDIEKLTGMDKKHAFAMLDAFLAKNKLQAILK
jgi:transcriptional regulator with XRE-family HTH domain